MQIVVDQRNDRRHRKDGQPQRHAGEPKQRERAQRRHQSALRFGTLATAQIASAVKAATTMKTARGSP